jgi:hypothetical protein
MLKNDIILQPHLRFKARTDLERVYDALDGRIFKDSEKNVLERQLKNIGLYSFEKPKDILRKVTLLNGKNNSISKIEDVEEEDVNENNNEMSKRGYKIKQNPLINEEKKEVKAKNNIYGSGNLYYIPKHLEYKPWRRRLDLNSEAERILSEYHVKTHFKAAEEIAENRLDYKKIENEFNNNLNYTVSNSSRFIRKNPFNFDDDIEKKLNKIEFKPYSKNYNPIKKYKNDNVDPESMKILTSLAFRNPDDGKNNLNEEDEKNQSLQYANIESKKKLIDENNVLIGNEILYKGTQFNLIANRVLNLCNVYRKKDKHNNTNLKKGNGKMMFTQGMTLNEFGNKYNLYE